MFRKLLTLPLSFALLAVLAGPALFAQSTLDTGSLRGKVVDSKGKTLPGAIIRAKGPQGIKAAETDGQGNYNLPFLTPGSYDVTVTMDGFSTQVQSGVVVQAQQITGQSFKMAEGSDTIIVKAGANIDTSSTAAITSVNLAEAMKNFAQSNSFASTFDFAPGTNSNSGIGGGNVSISGASGLENQYLISGINITNSGYGAIGAYDVVRGASGTGITTEFLDNLDIREGGFEAEYGGALGGVISATVRAGSNDFHGDVTAYYTPRSLEGGRNSVSRAGGFTNPLGNTNLDLAVSFGGPIVKDKLFFFVGYNPVWNRDTFRFDIDPADLVRDQIVAPNANLAYDQGNRRVDNYTAHLTWNINDKHKLDLIVIGAPESVSGSIRNIGRRVFPIDDPGIPINPPSATGVPNTDPVAGAQGSFKIKDTSAALKYFGSVFHNTNVEAQVSFHRSQVSEAPTADSDVIRYDDIRRLLVFNAQARNAGVPGVPSPPVVSPATYTFGGIGFYQGGTNDQTLDAIVKVTHNFNFGGAHEVKWGVNYTQLKFHENVVYSGPKPEVYLGSPLGTTDPSAYARLRTGAQAQVRCQFVDPTGTTFGTACFGVTRYRINRGNFNPAPSDTSNKEMNFFVQDTWTIKNVTFKLGVRYVKEKLSNPDRFFIYSSRTGGVVNVPDPASPTGQSPLPEFVGKAYQFQGEFSPRIGLSWDLLSNGKTKLYANFSRLYERVPNDLAVRSFGNEFGVARVVYINPDLTGQSGFPLTTGATPTKVQPGTRLPYKDDFSLGYQFQVAPRFIIDVKANYRKQGRILEDTQAASVEAIQNYYYSYLINYGYCSNCAPGQTQLFPGQGAAPFGQYVLANVGENAPTTFDQVYPLGTAAAGGCPASLPACDGQPTGVVSQVSFGKPKSNYKSLSVTAQKMVGDGEHLSLHATYRISRLTGNYEGLFRNDNGQSDPNITSLFDFPESHLTRTLFEDGRLNTDSPHALRIRAGYKDFFIKNLSASLTFKWQSGSLRTPLVAHPVYQNAGEIPGFNPQYYQFDFNSDGYSDFSLLKDYDAASRGYYGRNHDDATWDAGLAYQWNIGKSNLVFSVLVSNLFNANHASAYDENVETQTGIVNPFFNSPVAYHTPRTIRLGAKWSF